MAFKGLIGALRVDLGMNSAKFKKGSDEALSGMQKMQRKMAAVGSKMQGIGTKMSIGATLPLVALAKQSMDAAKVQEAAVASMESVLGSMGQAAGFTSAQLQDMASKLQNKSLFGDEDILQKVTGNLLTFGNVQGEVFSRASQMSLDLSARLGTDLQGSAIMLGKALNDPIAGVSALSRVGVSFTEQQKEMIKAMAGAGDVAGAQVLILDELDKQYAGQAEALRNLPAGQIQAATMAIGDAMEKVGSIILPVVAGIAVHIEGLAVKFQNLSPEVQKAIVVGGGLVAVLGPLAAAAGIAVAGIAALISPVGLVVAGVAALVAGGTYLIANWDDLSTRFPILQAAADLVRSSFEAMVPVFQFFGDQLQIVFSGVIAILDGDWSAAWAAAKAAFLNVNEAIVSVLSSLGKVMSDALVSLSEIAFEELKTLALNMRAWAGDVIDGFTQGIKDKANAAKEAVTGFAGDVTGWVKKKFEINSPSRVFKRIGGGLIEGLADGVKVAAPIALKAVEDMAARVTKVADRAMSRIGSGFATALSSGDISGAFSGLGTNILSGGRDAFSEVLQSAFSGGGAGFAGVVSGLKSAWGGVTGALSGGLSFAGIGSAISAALPIIGAVSGIVSLIKGFSSKKLLDSGFRLELSGGDLVGGAFEKWQKSSFWGLKKKTSYKVSAFDLEMSEALNGQINTVRDSVSQTYDALGIAIADGFLSGFSYNFGDISTRGMSEDEIAQVLSDAFMGYGDALSQAIGGVALEAAATLANVNAVINPTGQAFLGGLVDMAGAATSLIGSFGGLSELSSSVSGFVSTYFSQTEQMGMVSDQVAGVFDQLGMAIPDTLRGFRELVLSQDLMTDSGRAAYQALLGVSDGFAAVQSALSADFDLSSSNYATEYEARLAQVAEARGYSTITQVAQTSGTTQIGRTSLGGDDGAVQLLQTMLGIFKDWDQDGYPQQRTF